MFDKYPPEVMEAYEGLHHEFSRRLNLSATGVEAELASKGVPLEDLEAIRPLLWEAFKVSPWSEKVQIRLDLYQGVMEEISDLLGIPYERQTLMEVCKNLFESLPGTWERGDRGWCRVCGKTRYSSVTGNVGSLYGANAKY